MSTTSAAAVATGRTKVLCVDDEPNVLEGLSLHLRRRFDVTLAGSGAEGLEALSRDREVAVVISDMRMPSMDGATFLARSREVAPEAVRMLLTGQTDLASAISAVNLGGLFRFLTKPCPPATLLESVDAAVAQHRLITAERVLLEQTLHGSVRALVDILALASPVSFGRANRIRQLVSELAAHLQVAERWQVEMAAMLSQIGYMSLPPDTLEKLHQGQPLGAEEEQMVARVPDVTDSLLKNIPRIEGVRGILTQHGRAMRLVSPTTTTPAAPGKGVIHQGAQMLSVAVEFDSLSARGESAERVIALIKGRAGRYDAVVVEALVAVRGTAAVNEEVLELRLDGLRVGMRFAEDVKLVTGTLLVTRGSEVTPGFVARARNFRGSVKEPIRVVVSTAQD